MKVAMIGVGKLGAPCANEMWKAGHEVIGYDVNLTEKVMFPMANSIEEAAEGRKIIFIAVPTPHAPAYGGETPTSHLPPKDFDYSIVKRVLTELNKCCTEDQTVVLISTVLPGTVRREFKPLLKNATLIYNPYLIAMGSVEYDMLNPEMVIIGHEPEDFDQAYELKYFYETFLNDDSRYERVTWEEAECIKIFYNTWISTKIALVNMMQDVAEGIGHTNVDRVTNALAKSNMRITGPAYMRAGMGDAGACHPRDNIALSHLAKELNLGYDLFEAIMTARENQAEKLADKLVSLSERYKLPIFIHGKAYKPGVEYTHGSYSLLVGYYVKQLGDTDPIYIDPMTGDNIASVKGVVLLAHDAETTYSHAEAIGSKRQRMYCEIEPGSVVVDPWRRTSWHEAEGKGWILHSYGNTSGEIID